MFVQKIKFKESDILLPVEIAGIKFRNPFYVGSGPTTMTIEQLKRIEETGWGGAALKLTIDPAPYINRYPRYGYWERGGILSFTTERRMTLAEGLKLMEHGRRETRDIILFSNITYSGDKGVAGWVNMAKKFEEAGAHANELNMCCPNMSYNVEVSEGSTRGPRTGASLGTQENAIREIIQAIKAETKIPLFVKLTPEGGRIAQVAKVCFEAGADMVGGTANRLAIHNVDLDNPVHSPIRLQEEISMQCMCSEWIHPLGLRDIYEMRKLNGPKVKISGAGGIRDLQSAAQAVLCGADTLCICAETLISGFGFLPKVIAEFKEWMKKQGYKSLADFRDMIPPKITAAPSVTLYQGTARHKDKFLSAPCVHHCPAHIPAQAYISHIADNEFREAFDIINAAAPLQSICGYICNHPCEKECTRGEKDEPIRIRELKRFALELGWGNGWDENGKPAKKKGKSVAVIGSGPSGITAAKLLSGAGYTVTIYEKETRAGGMLRYAIPLFRLPESVLENEIKALEKAGVSFKYEMELGRNITLADLKKGFDAVYLALGAQKGTTSAIKGETSRGVMTALDFLKQVSLGKKVALGRKVAVIGGGFTAVDSARAAIRLGAKEVFILYRRTKDEMPATPEEVREAEEEGIKVMYLVTPVQILAVSGRVKAIRMVNCVLGEADKSNRRRPEPVEPAEFELPVDTIIYAVGQAVSLPRGEKLPVTDWGSIKTDSDGFTGIKGIYAGGDATLGASSVIEAVACGKQAAFAIDRDLSGGKPVLLPLEKTTLINVEARLARHGNEERKWRVPLHLVEGGKRRKTFKEYVSPMTEKEAVAEASRCFRCGCGEGCQICYDICKKFAWDLEGTRVSLREDDCVACGMCAWRCPNDNIEMVKTSDKPI